MKKATCALIFSSCLFCYGIHAESFNYDIKVEGVSDPDVLRTFKSISKLKALKKKAPSSLNALRYRAESDVPELLKVLHSYGFYESSVHIEIEDDYEGPVVLIKVDEGPLYTIQSYEIRLINEKGEEVHSPRLTLESIGIKLDKPANSRAIINGELNVLRILSEIGYPLAEVKDRKTLVDGKTKQVRFYLDIKLGPLCYFGSALIEGTKYVRHKFITERLAWKEDEVYDSSLVKKTQNELMDSGLFSSVFITHSEKPTSNNELPMNIEVVESKHRSLNLGTSYQTYWGFGASFGWENRNLDGMGRKLSLQGEITKRSHSGIATFSVPNFRKMGQDLVFQAQAMHEAIVPYSDRSYSFTTRMEKTFNKRFSFTLGLKGDRLFITNSVQDENVLVLSLPFFLRYSTSNSLLNPTRGNTVEYKAVPSLVSKHDATGYLHQKLTYFHYLALRKDEFVVLAQKLTFETIFSTAVSAIPVPNRVLAGSEEELRGYRYRTVSPLNDEGKPIGGRCGVYYSLETRFRLSRTVGLSPFLDIGNVYSSQVPNKHEKWLKSVGVGLVYFTFLGPLRCDVAFPLDRRPNIDPNYRFLIGIGQSF